MANSRPQTTADLLFAVASFLDAGDSAFQQLAQQTDRQNPVSGSNVQEDLRTLAHRLRDNPELDAQVRSLLPD